MVSALFWISTGYFCNVRSTSATQAACGAGYNYHCIFYNHKSRCYLIRFSVLVVFPFSLFFSYFCTVGTVSRVPCTAGYVFTFCAASKLNCSYQTTHLIHYYYSDIMELHLTIQCQLAMDYAMVCHVLEKYTIDY